MSGGHFDYSQSHINYIIDSIEEILLNREKYAIEDPFVINEIFEGLSTLRRAYVYAQRIDWLVSCDDSEQTFLKSLDKELHQALEDHTNFISKYANAEIEKNRIKSNS